MLEVKLLLNRMNVEITERYLKDLFNKFDQNRNETIDYEEFVKMMDHIRQRDEVLPYFKKYKNPQSGLIHAHELKRFMLEV